MFQILVVEDDRHTAHLMKEVLNAAGYEVFQAGDGLEALEVMDHQHVDLILLDIMMPNMDGYEFVETVRESGDMIPVLMLTAKELRQDKIRGFKSGVDDYITQGRRKLRSRDEDIRSKRAASRCINKGWKLHYRDKPEI